MIMHTDEMVTVLDKDLYRAAYMTACIGAPNPVAVAASLHDLSSRLLRVSGSHDTVKEHPALRAITSHLASLYSQGDGPDGQLLRIIVQEAARHGICDTAGTYL